MSKQIIALLLICSLAIYANAGDTGCHADCGAGGVGVGCAESGGSATGPATHCMICANAATHKVLMTTTTGTYGTCTLLATACAVVSATLPGAKVYKASQTVLYFCIATTDQTGQSKLCTTYTNSGADYYFATVADALADCTSCAATGQSMAIALAADAKGSCVDTTAPCDVNTKYLLKTTSTVAAGTMLTFCDQGGSGKFKCGVCTAKATDGTATLCATLAFTSTDYSFAADPADRCLTCTTTATYNIKAGDAATTNQYGTCTAITTACGTTFPKIQSGASAVIYYCAALVDLETTFYKKCTTVSQTIASHIYATINAYQIDCTTCAATGESLVITLVADTKGYCALTTNPCDVNTKYLAKTTSTVAAGAMLTYCDQGTGGKFRCAVCTAKSTVRCATFKFSATDYSFDAEPASRCATCTTAADIMLLAGSTDYYGECLASSTDFSTKCLTNGYRQFFTHASLAHCGAAAAGATLCVLCAPVTDCATVYYPSGKATYLTTDSLTASALCLTCQVQGANAAALYFVKVTANGATSGTCTLYSAHGCAADEVVVIQDTSFGRCTQVTIDASGTPLRQVCATWATQTTRFATMDAAKDECITCSGSSTQMLLETATGVNKGKCVLLSSFATKAHCSTTSTVLVKEENTGGAGPDSRSSNCKSATYFCGYCATSTKCATFFYATAVVVSTTESANGVVFATLTAAELSCLTCTASHYVELALADNVAGSCTAAADVPCGTATQALIQVLAATVSGTVHEAYNFCKAPVVESNLQPCTTFKPYTAPFTTNLLALAGCLTCSAIQVLKVSATGVTPGSCVAHADLQTICGSGFYMKGSTNAEGVCVAATAATLTGDTASAQSQNCGTYNYASGVYLYASDALALVNCLTCTTTSFSVIGDSDTATLGKCKSLASIQEACGDFKYLKQVGSTTINYCVDSKDQISTTLNCKTYFYDASFQKYADNAAAFTKCLTCTSRKLFVKASLAATYGKCYDNPWSPVVSCTTNQYVYASSADAFIGYCIDGANGASGQMKCKTYFYGENLLFPTSVTAFNDNCFNCDAGQVLLRKAGEKRGKCFDTNANAEATCGGLSWYLRQSTGGDINFAADATTPFTFCEQSAIPTNTFQKQCLTFKYATIGLDKTPEQANDYCLTCGLNQLLLEAAAGNGYGTCIFQNPASACTAGWYIMKETSIGSQLTGVCSQATATSPVTICDKFFYSTNLFIDAIPAAANLLCTGCASGKLLLVADQAATSGKCYHNIGTAYTVPGNGKFLKKINHLLAANIVTLNSGTTATIVEAQTSNLCTVFAYTNNLGFYKDVYEADSDCTTCTVGAKIVGAFKSCVLSTMCKTFESGIVFKNLEEAERKCLTCQSGYVLIKAAADASGVCTPSVECSNFNDASFTDLASSVSKCYTCKSGFANIKAVDANVFGTCTASTKCSDSSTPIALTLAVFEADCSKCASGFYKIAKVVDTANCKEIPAAANCKLSFNAVIATDEDATAKCVLCKDGFYPKDAANNGYGPCTAIVRKYTCLAFLEGAATTELIFTTTKCALCPQDFYYRSAGNCLRCPGQCRTCLPTSKTDVDDFNTDNFCTSCFAGSADLFLYTNQRFGICRTCGAGCATCSAVYINTATDANNKKCESCTLPAYFALEKELDVGTCSPCDVKTPNCRRCSGMGACVQCNSGYFQTKNETLQCLPCASGCAVCVDEGRTCLKFTCSNGCQECSSSTVCTACSVGFYKSGDTCTQCTGGCLECTAADACSRKDPSVKAADCVSNCFACSANTAEGCTTPTSGYFRFSDGAAVPLYTIEPCITGCKTCSSHAFASCTECSAGFYKNDMVTVCDKCHFSCAQCNGPTMRECNYCNAGFYLQQEFQGINDGFCAICDYNSCKTCGGRAPTVETSCTSCYGSKIIDLFFEGAGIKNGKCIDSCPEGKFNDGGFCKGCRLGSPTPCPQAPAAVAASYLAFPLILIALIIMML